MRNEYKFILKSSNQNFFISVYLFFRYLIYIKFLNKKIKRSNKQSLYQDLIKDKLKIDQDWFSHNINNLDYFFKKKNLYNQEINALEIGSYEGNSSFFFLKYFSNLNLTCVDTFGGSDELKNFDFKNVYENFKFNTKDFEKRITVYKLTSDEFFKNYKNNIDFDLIYIDGSHYSKDVYNDAINSLKVLKKNGYIIFDDFLWNYYKDVNDNPIGGIKSFLIKNFFKIKILSVSYQIIVQKL